MRPLTLRLPATSANLGPGFDAVGLAMSLFLNITAEEAKSTSIVATGRDRELVSALDRNLILTTYRELAPHAPHLSLTIHNEIPLGMGCGSSAAALLAGVRLANHFGQLGLSEQTILEEACVREGHPDNIAACFYGGMTVSHMQGGVVRAATFGKNLNWRLFLVIPSRPLATEEARSLLPKTYTRADAVANIQSTALLVAAFAQARPELLFAATQDRIHQPYRSDACALLPMLLPLASAKDFYAVTLSGAGPSVLLLADPACSEESQLRSIEQCANKLAAKIVSTSIYIAAS